MNINELVIYRNLKHEDLFEDMAGLMGLGKEGQKADPFACAGELVELAVEYGFEGNLWHCFLALCLADNENAYTTTCEIRGNAGGTLDMLAKNDYRIFKALFDYDLETLEPAAMWKEIAHYRPSRQESRVFNRRIRDRIVDLAVLLEQSEDENEFQSHMAAFYGEYGVGKFGLNKAFRIIEKEEEHKVIIDPIINVEHIYFKDIVGYEMQKKKLIENTEAFISGKEANNVLLFGDAGTGKSSSVKAILNEYYGQGLRMIEVYKHQFKALSEVLEQIKDRNYKFIIYMDDLSFEEYELEYKYLKAILEGGLGKRPKNVLIYATSNRRHLIREKFSDKRELDDDLHNNDTVQEKLSLAARFGVTIYYGSPDKFQFQGIVKALAEKYHLDMPEEELLLEANKWEISHGGLSGRTASQFITHLLGRK
uniref:ATP-binding protein n=1 Tax=Enterocloster sp. TaxID=2719315 RepID=UPI003FEEDE23